MSDPRARRPSPGDPRLRVALFLLVGGLLIFASFNDGPSQGVKQARLAATTRADEAAASERSALLTSEHRKVLSHSGPVVISAPTAVQVGDLAVPGRFRCAVGLTVNNNSGEDIADLEFGIRYAGPGGVGSTVHSVALGGLEVQSLTPVNATLGDCEGLTGQVAVYRCSYVNGGDCARRVAVLRDGPVALSRAP